jgi:hypothetical protein
MLNPLRRYFMKRFYLTFSCVLLAIIFSLTMTTPLLSLAAGSGNDVSLTGEPPISRTKLTVPELTAPLAQARSFEGGMFEISSRKGDDRCFDIPNATSCVKEKLQSFSRNGHNNQKFIVKTDEPSNWFKIIAVHSGLCLEVLNGDDSNGATIQQATCVAGDGKQLWRIRDNPGGGFYEIYWKGNEKCIDLTNGDERDNTPIRMFKCNGGKNQAWDLRPTVLNRNDPTPKCEGDCGYSHGFTGCGAACMAAFPAWYGQLILAFKEMRRLDISECEARATADDGSRLASQLTAMELGPLAGQAANIAGKKCGQCAVDSAY